jgi:hypothetical protein
MDVRLLLRLVPVLAFGGFAAWLAAVVLLLPAGNATAIVIVRTLLCIGFLVFLTRVMVRRAYAGGGLAPAVLTAAMLSYALFPPAWAGRALFGQEIADPGVVTAAIDLVVWLAVVALAGRSVEPREAPAGYQPYVQA